MGSKFTLGDKCTVKSSKRIFAREYVEQGIPFWRSKDVIDKALGVFSNYDLYISEERFEEINSRFGSPRKGDLLMSSVGNRAGQPYVIEQEENFYFKDGNILWLSEFNDINPRFLAYWLKSDFGQNKLSSVMIGSAQKALTIDAIRNLDVNFPSEGYQDKAVKILLSFDSKISVNQQTNQTLEKMAQTLFKSWFVDFDPVFDNALAKADFNLEALPSGWPAALLQRATSRLQVLQDNPTLKAKLTQHNQVATESDIALAQTSQAENTHQHFPSEFETTDEPSIGINGWIPKGWKVIPVSKAIKVNPRTTLSKGTIAKFADMKSIPTSGYMVDEIIEKAFSGGAKFKQCDVLLARITPCLQNGKTALVDFLADDEVGFGSTEFIVLRENKQISYPFIACLAREESFRAHCMQSMVGSSGRQRVQNACFDDYYLALPKESIVLNYFTEFTKPNFTKMMSNKLDSQSLIKLRDALLPKLISGEITLDKDVTK